MSQRSPTQTRESRAQQPPPPIIGRRGPPAHLMGSQRRAQDTRGTLHRLWGYVSRQRAMLVGVFLLIAASTALELVGPYLMGMAIDEYVLQGDVRGLARMAAWMLLAHLGRSATTWLQTYAMVGVAQRAVRDIRNDLFANLQTLSLRFFDQHTHGELMSRLTNDIENISNVLAEGVAQLIASALTIVGVTAVTFAINVRLAGVTILAVPVMMVLSRWIARHTRRGFRDQQERLGELNGIIEETVTGQHVVKAYVRENVTINQFDEVNLRLREASTRAQVFAGVMGPLMNFVNNAAFAIVAGAGGWLAVLGLATVGTIASFVSYSREFAWPLNQIANLYNSIQSAVAGAERVFEIVDETLEIEDAVHALPLTSVRSDVVFDNVCSGYEESVPVLRNVSLHAAAGHPIALVGPTGAGKTTIVNLLTRFYDVDRGAIRVDGTDVRNLKRDDLRRALGIVLQDTFLFSDTMTENIRYGRLDATDEEVVAAARLANADHFIRRLPQGYDTVLSERGSNLSQGQRQLPAIARAILADPKILILDEATSSVDTRTERHIQEAMLRLMAGRTSFVIAHRLSTIREVDRILVIDDGEIIERGTHHELLDRRGFYRRLYMSQFRGALAPATRAESPS